MNPEYAMWAFFISAHSYMAAGNLPMFIFMVALAFTMMVLVLLVRHSH